MRIPLFATAGALDPLKPAIQEAVARVIDGGRYILGPEVAAFEEELAGAMCGADHAVGVAQRHRRADDRAARHGRRAR